MEPKKTLKKVFLERRDAFFKKAIKETKATPELKAEFQELRRLSNELFRDSGGAHGNN